MSEHRYRQYCALARALDVAGDRWTLLIVRELAPGPRRFTDLTEGLPGISRNLLTQRLRALEADGIIARHELEPPAARQVYELTDAGRQLSEAMSGLIAWGAKRLGERDRNESFQPRWSAVAMAAIADRDAAKGVHETYQYVIDRAAFYFTVDDGEIQLHDGRAEDPAVVVTTDEQTWAKIVAGKLTTAAAAERGALTVMGDKRALGRLRKILSPGRLFAQADAMLTGAR